MSNRVTVNDAAKLLVVSRQAVQGMIRSGRLDAVPDSRGHLMIDSMSLERIQRESVHAESGISTAEAARRLGVTERSVRRYVEQGRLTALFVRGEYRIDPTSLAGFVGRPAGRPKADES